MTNFAIVVVIAAFICAINVHVYADDGADSNDSGSSPKWGSSLGENLQNQMPPMNMPKMTMPSMDLPNPDEILNLKPKDQNTKVAGTYQSYSSSVETKDGHVVNKSASSKSIDNKNGNVTEVDASS